MSKPASQVLEEALSLSPEERAEVAERLLNSLESPAHSAIDELWASEAEDRVEAFECGVLRSVPFPSQKYSLVSRTRTADAR